MKAAGRISLVRRRLAGAMLAGSAVHMTRPLGAVAAQQRGASRAPTINVKDFGAFGDGRLPDLRQVRAAVDRAVQHPNGAVILFPRGEYFLGAADEAYLVEANRLQNVRFVGEQATISCGSVNGSSSMLVLDGCRNITFEGLTFRDRGLKRNIDWLGAAAIRVANQYNGACENIQITDCRFDSVLSALVCRETDPRIRSRGIRVENVNISRSYYGLSFQDNGDDLVARRLRCEDVKRSYFPYGISNHDVELEAVNNATGFTDVLLKSYRRSTTNIRVKLRSRGKRSGDAIVNFDHEDEVPGLALRNIRLDVDIDDADCRLDTAIMFRAMDKQMRVRRATTRRWEEISIDGDVRICPRTALFEIASVSQTPGVLRIGPRLARNPRLPSSFKGFRVEIART